MQVTFLGVVAFLIFVLSFTASRRFVVTAFAFAGLLQASAAFFIGGNGVTPAHFLLLALCVRCLREPHVAWKLWQQVRFPSPGFFLLALGIYAVVSAAFFPRLFAGVTYVNPIVDSAAPSSYLNPPLLAPTMGNATQSVYVLGSFAVFFMIGILFDKGRNHTVLMKALLIYAVGNVVFGLLDLVTYYTHTAFLLDVVRNSNYTFHTDETAALGLKRISGSFTETSAFSAVTLSTLAFTLRLFLGGVYSRAMLVLSLMEVLLLAFSTSSTALAGLPLVIGGLWSASVVRLFKGRFRTQDAAFSLLLPIGVLAFASGIALWEPARVAVSDMLNAVLFEKSTSASGIERLAFNAQALKNFWDTRGIGAGLGSLRASSFLLAVIASVGVPGAVLLSLFLRSVFFGSASPSDDGQGTAFRQAARAACFAILVGASISGTSMELGLMFFMFAGAACLPRDAAQPSMLMRHAAFRTRDFGASSAVASPSTFAVGERG